MPTHSVAVVVLNWNRWRDTLTCLESLRPAVRQDLARVIVVDNCSTDNSLAQLSDWLRSADANFLDVADDELASPALRAQNIKSSFALVRSGRNGGYAAGNNLGIKLALHWPETEYVFILNNDTVVERECISRLLDFAQRDDAIAVLGSTLIEEGRRARTAGGNRYNVILTTTSPAIAFSAPNASHIDFVTGAAQFIRADVLRQVGVLSEDYFLYFEELDFTRRISKAGYRIAWCPESVVHHTHGRTAGSRSEFNSTKSALAEYHSNLSCLIFTRKHHPTVFWLAAVSRFALKVVHSILYLRFALLLPLVRAYRDYLLRGNRTPA